MFCSQNKFKEESFSNRSYTLQLEDMALHEKIRELYCTVKGI